MRLIATIIFGFFFCSMTFAASSEEFYIFPMGQGNGQLVIYNVDHPGNKVGVLYDLGSKSLQSHPKFIRRGDWSLKFTPRQVLFSREDQQKPNLIDDGPSPDRAMTSATAFATPDTTERKVVESQRTVLKKDLQGFIKEVLSELKHLILFLSHTDVDHINYISDATIPSDLKMIAFLCGDWLGDSCDYSADGETPSVVKRVLSFLARRKDTHLEFPYYWKNNVYLDPTSQSADFNQYVREKLQTLNTETNIDSVFKDLAELASSRSIHAPTPSFCTGSLDSVLPIPLRNTLKSDAHIMTAISNTFVWSLNLPVGDVNDFSPILSCNLPSLNLSVVFTGDAGLPVFQSVSCRHTSHPKNSFIETLSDQIDDQHLVLLMLPHHGSWLNISGEMLRFFRPSVFGISAGDGGQHGHPSLKTIAWIQKVALQERLHGMFDSRFKKEQDVHIIAIRDQTDADSAKYPHKVVKMRKGFPVFLCPNIYGCIKWNKEGIQTNFNNTIDIAGNKYYVAYASHELETIEKLNTKSNGDIVQPCMVQGDSLQQMSLTYLQTLTEDYLPYVHLLKDISNDIQYVGVPVEGKTYFYRVIPVEPVQPVIDRKRARTTGEGRDSERDIGEPL